MAEHSGLVTLRCHSACHAFWRALPGPYRTTDDRVRLMTVNISKADLLLRRAVEDDGPEGLVALNLLRRMLKGRADAFSLTDASTGAPHRLLWVVREKDRQLELARDQLADAEKQLDKLRGQHRPTVEPHFIDQYRAIMAALADGAVFRRQIVEATGLSVATVRRRCVELVNSRVLSASARPENYTIQNGDVLNKMGDK